jgi:hypothetical protein
MNFSDLRTFLCTTPTSMTYSFDRLMGLAQQTFEQDPLSGHVFLFLNQRIIPSQGVMQLPIAPSGSS